MPETLLARQTYPFLLACRVSYRADAVSLLATALRALVAG
jgi:hypothetical protein